MRRRLLESTPFAAAAVAAGGVGSRAGTTRLPARQQHLPYLTLPYLTLPHLTLHYLTTLPHLTLPHLDNPVDGGLDWLLHASKDHDELAVLESLPMTALSSCLGILSLYCSAASK